MISTQSVVAGAEAYHVVGVFSAAKGGHCALNALWQVKERQWKGQGKAVPRAVGGRGKAAEKAVAGQGKAVEGQGKAVAGQGKAAEGQGKAVAGQGKAVAGQGKAVEGRGKAVGGRGKAVGRSRKGSGRSRKAVEGRGNGTCAGPGPLPVDPQLPWAHPTPCGGRAGGGGEEGRR